MKKTHLGKYLKKHFLTLFARPFRFKKGSYIHNFRIDEQILLMKFLANFEFRGKVEKVLKGSLDSILSPLPSVKIQIMGGKIWLRCKGETLLGVVNKLLETKSLLTTPGMFCL